MTRVEGETDLYSIEVPTEAKYIIFNNGSGGTGNQTADLTIPTDGKNLYDYSAGTWSTYGASTEPVADVAAVGDTQYATIEDALRNWTSGTTLKLLADVTYDGMIYAPSGILDLNGQTLTANSGIWVLENVDLTICDSSEEQDGALTSTNADAIVVHDGTLTVSGGTIESENSYVLYVDGGEVTVEGGTIQSEEMVAIYVVGGEVTVEGGALTSTNADAIAVSGGTLTVSGGTIKSVEGIALYVEGGEVTVEDGSLTSMNSDAIDVSGGTLTVSGGTIESEKSYVLYVDGGEVTVEGGALTSTNDTAIAVSGGTLTVEGGTISGMWGIRSYYANAVELSGAPNITGEASDLYVDDPDCAITITGALTGNATYSVEMGTLGVFAVAAEDYTITQDDAASFTSYDDSYGVFLEYNTLALGEPAADVATSEAKWGADADHLTNSGTLDEAIAAAATDSTVKYIQLQSDVESNFVIHSGAFTIDLNGKKVSSDGYAFDIAGAGTEITFVDSNSADDSVGRVSSNDESSSAIMVSDGASVIILGGEYEAPNDSVIVDADTSVTILDGTFKGTEGEAVSSKGTLIIKGGSFDAGADCGMIQYCDGVLDLSNYSGVEDISVYIDTEVAVKPEDGTIKLPDGFCFYDEDDTAVASLAVGHTYTIGEVIPHEHDYSDGICSNCGMLDAVFMGSNLVLEGNIGINFYFRINDAIANSEDAFMRFTFEDGRDSIEISVKDAKIDTTSKPGTTLYVFSCDVFAKQMTDTVTAQIVMGEHMSKAYEHSVVRYAEMLLNSTAYTEECKALVKAMLNYGANAQTNFNYHTERPANANLTDEEIAAVTAIGNGVFDNYDAIGTTSESVGIFAGSNLVLKSETTINVYFKPAVGVSIESLTFTVDGESVTPELTTIGEEDYYMITIENIAAQDLEKTYEVVASDGTESSSYTVSAFSYCHDAMKQTTDTVYTEALKNTLKAMYLYNEAANNYFDN